MKNNVTKRELARLLHCSNEDAYDRADARGIPCELREGIRADGSTRVYRVYIRHEVLAALDERGRQSARSTA